MGIFITLVVIAFCLTVLVQSVQKGPRAKHKETLVERGQRAYMKRRLRSKIE
jgi:hypothetical protein